MQFNLPSPGCKSCWSSLSRIWIEESQRQSDSWAELGCLPEESTEAGTVAESQAQQTTREEAGLLRTLCYSLGWITSLPHLWSTTLPKHTRIVTSHIRPAAASPTLLASLSHECISLCVNNWPLTTILCWHFSIFKQQQQKSSLNPRKEEKLQKLSLKPRCTKESPVLFSRVII